MCSFSLDTVLQKHRWCHLNHNTKNGTCKNGWSYSTCAPAQYDQGPLFFFFFLHSRKVFIDLYVDRLQTVSVNEDDTDRWQVNGCARETAGIAWIFDGAFVTGNIHEIKFNRLKKNTRRPVNAHLTPGPGIYFNAFIHVYSPGQGQTTLWRQMLMSTESPYHCPFVASFKTISLKHDFIHVYSPGARADKPLGDKLLMSTESPYHFDHFFQVSNKSFWHIF